MHKHWKSPSHHSIKKECRVKAFILNENKEALLIKSGRCHSSWSFIGGRIYPGEDKVKHLTDKIYQEARFMPEIGSPITTIFREENGRMEPYATLYRAYMPKDFEIRHNEYIEEHGWFDLESITNFAIGGDLTTLTIGFLNDEFFREYLYKEKILPVDVK